MQIIKMSNEQYENLVNETLEQELIEGQGNNQKDNQKSEEGESDTFDQSQEKDQQSDYLNVRQRMKMKLQKNKKDKHIDHENISTQNDQVNYDIVEQRSASNSETKKKTNTFLNYKRQKQKLSHSQQQDQQVGIELLSDPEIFTNDKNQELDEDLLFIQQHKQRSKHQKQISPFSNNKHKQQSDQNITEDQKINENAPLEQNTIASDNNQKMEEHLNKIDLNENIILQHKESAEKQTKDDGQRNKIALYVQKNIQKTLKQHKHHKEQRATLQNDNDIKNIQINDDIKQNQEQMIIQSQTQNSPSREQKNTPQEQPQINEQKQSKENQLLKNESEQKQQLEKILSEENVLKNNQTTPKKEHVTQNNQAINMTEKPIGIATQQQQMAEYPIDQQDDQIENSLEAKLKSPKFQIRMDAFIELRKWDDDQYTPEIFVKQLHIFVKERHHQVIDELLYTIESLITDYQSIFEQCDFKKLLANFVEHLLNNVKNESKNHANKFIILLWDNTKKNEFIEQLKTLLSTIKIKIQEKALLVILELLKDGRIEELDYLKVFFPDLEKLYSSRTLAVRTLAQEIYKEIYLWIGDAVRPFLANMKQQYQEELNKYYKTVTPEQMKVKKSQTTQGNKTTKKIDVYDIVQEIDMPKKYNEDAWVDDILSQKKWNEKKKRIDELNDFLTKNPKISSKTNTVIFLTLAKRIFMESNVSVQISVVKLLGLLASCLRKSFGMQAKTLFSTLLDKLKEKHKPLIDEILSSLENFYIILSLDETIDDLNSICNEKSIERKINVLKLLLSICDKQEKFKTELTSKKLTTFALRLIDENDPSIRDLSMELIAKQIDTFEEKVCYLLKDLPSQKMSKINKYRTKQSTMTNENTIVDSTTPNQRNIDEDNEDNDKQKNMKRNMAKDKSQMIADLRENIFSNKTVKISDQKNFSSYLQRSLQQLSDMTKDFKEVNNNQAKEIFILIEQITSKVDKAAFPEENRKIVTQFFIEQSLGKQNKHLQNAIDNYINCSSRIITSKIFLQDAFNVIIKKDYKPSRELLILLLKLYDKEIQEANKLSQLPHKVFTDFLKNCFSSTINATFKTPLFGTMRNLIKKFGDRSCQDFPQGLIKELQNQNMEAQKIFSKIFEKIEDKNPEKRKQALIEISNYDDPSKVLLFWSNNNFLQYLKRQLMMEKNEEQYQNLLLILTNYINLHENSPFDFSLNNFVYIFQAILTAYYDNHDEGRMSMIEQFIFQTTNKLTPVKIIEELISDSNSISWREQILKFFFQFADKIDPSIKIMNYIIQLVGPRGPPSDVKGMIDQVLLVIKNNGSDEVILKGNENKLIREIWLKNEEDLLIDPRILQGDRLFDEQTTYNVLKQFLIVNLKIEESQFYSKNIEQFQFGETETSIKVKLTYLYIRSIENLNKVIEFILKQFMTIDFNQLEQVGLLLSIRILFNVQKNLLYQSKEEIFAQSNNLFLEALDQLNMSTDELKQLMGFSPSDAIFFDLLINNSNSSDVSYITHQQQFHDQTQYPENIIPQLFKKKNNPIQPEKIQEKSQDQIKRQTEKIVNNQFETNLGINDLSINQQSLFQILEKMESYEIAEFEEVSSYFKQLCRSQNEAASQFLRQNCDIIIQKFIQVLTVIFSDGINFDVPRINYESIFMPLQQLILLPGLIDALSDKTFELLIDHVLTRLVLSNEEKLYEQQQISDTERIQLAEYMVKFWNSVMLKLIEFSNPSIMLQSLFNIILSFQNQAMNKIQENIFLLAFKCIIRITRNLKQILHQIDPCLIFTLIHYYNMAYGINNDEALSTKAIKTLTNELISLSEPEYIWQCYYETFQNDFSEKYIKQQIQTIFNQNEPDFAKNVVQQNFETELIELIQEANKKTKKSQIIAIVPKFVNILSASPNLQIQNYLDLFVNKHTVQLLLSELKKQGNKSYIVDKDTSINSYQIQSQYADTSKKSQISNKKQGLNNKKKNIAQYLNTSDMSEQIDFSKNQPFSKYGQL